MHLPETDSHPSAAIRQVIDSLAHRHLDEHLDEDAHTPHCRRHGSDPSCYVCAVRRAQKEGRH